LASLCGVLAVVGCEPTVDSLCDDLADECGSESFNTSAQQCIDDGDRLESRADEKECDGPFDLYLNCVDEHRCAWDTACVEQRTELEHCVNLAEWREAF
jgi:hypothetical protein